jgi:hypothetical protein
MNHLKKNYCRVCGELASHGEKKWLFWRWWCRKHYMQRFSKMVESSPLALTKYIKIYGKKPSEVLK